MRRLTAMAVFLGITALPAISFAAGDVPDEMRMQAQLLHEQAMKLEATDPRAALTALRSSYEIHANYQVLYSIGRVCAKLGERECALRAYEDYLKAGGTEVSTKRRKEVEGSLKSLSRRPTGLTIKSSIVGAFVKVDGSVVGRIPLEKPVTVSPGTHKVVLVSDGNVLERSVEVSAGSTEAVEIEAEKGDSAPAAAESEEARAEQEPTTPETKAESASAAPSSSSDTPIVPWLVAGAFAVATGVTGALTTSASSDYEALKNRYPISRGALEEAHEEGRDLLLITGALGAATVVSVGIASYFTFFGGSATKERTVGLAVGPTGVSLTGRLP